MTILCLKGNKALDLKKGRVYPVLAVTQLDKKLGHQIRIVLQLPGKTRSLYVPSVHKNKLGDAGGFNVHNGGDPTNKARVKFQGRFTILTFND